MVGVVGNQLGWLDPIKDRFLIQESQQILEEPVVIEAAPEELIPEVVEEAIVEEPIEELVVEAVAAEEILETIEAVEIPEPEVIALPLVDFSRLPPPTAELRVSQDGEDVESVTVRLREDRGPATVDLMSQRCGIFPHCAARRGRLQR